eukprot:scaffold30907_cov61-Cyclotella_meneghiniana.AAC.2
MGVLGSSVERKSTPMVESISPESILNPLKVSDLESLTVPQLKDLLRSKGLTVGGRKNELIARLMDDNTIDNS